MVFFFAIRLAPFAKLEDNNTGSNKGVIPIAIATEKVNATTTPCLATFIIKVMGISTNIKRINNLLTLSIPF